MTFLVRMPPQLALGVSEAVSKHLPAGDGVESQGSAAILVDQLQHVLGSTLTEGGVIKLAELIAVLNSVQSARGAGPPLVTTVRRWRNALLVALTIDDDSEVMTSYNKVLVVGAGLRPRGLEKLPTRASMKRWSERSRVVLRDSADARRQLALSSERHLASLGY